VVSQGQHVFSRSVSDGSRHLRGIDGLVSQKLASILAIFLLFVNPSKSNVPQLPIDLRSIQSIRLSIGSRMGGSSDFKIKPIHLIPYLRKCFEITEGRPPIVRFFSWKLQDIGIAVTSPSTFGN
jgi:hypothetical protein